MDIDSTPALSRAIELAGGQTALAQRLSAKAGRRVSQPLVWWWLNRSKVVPAEFCKAIEAVTDGAVKAQELRPDVFGGAA